MGPILSSLVDLQIVEHKIRRTKEKLKKGNQTILRQEQHIKQLQETVVAKHEEIKLSRLQYGRADLDLKQRESEVARFRVSLNSAKTNKEYSAVLTQINTNRADLSKLEDQLLQLMTHIEENVSICKEIEASIETETQQLAEIRREISQQQETVKHDLQQLQEQRLGLAGQVPDKFLSMFNRLAERYDGEVLAEVAHSNGKKKTEQSCKGCFMSLPLEIVNNLMSHDDVMTCPNCGRMLVLDMTPKKQPVS
jgi:uncharacterized protein